jgi:hypothetical protein
MATITLDGRDFDLAPFKLGALRKAAPILDRINAASGSLDSMEVMVDSSADIIEVLAIGLVKIDPAMTAEAVLDIVGFDELPMIQRAFVTLMQESGLAPKGEAQAPAPTPEAVGALPNA